MADKGDTKFEGLHITTEKVAPPAPPAKRGTRRDPKNALDIAILARRRVRKMLDILTTIAKDSSKVASARVSAAKVILDLAKLDPAQVREMDDEAIFAAAKKIVLERSTSLAQTVQKAVNREVPITKN